MIDMDFLFIVATGAMGVATVVIILVAAFSIFRKS
jgi:hypothetical protein